MGEHAAPEGWRHDLLELARRQLREMDRHKDSRYIRIRQGSSLSRATTAASQIPVEGQPADLARELETRLRGCATDDRSWVEVLISGHTDVVDTVLIPPLLDDGGGKKLGTSDQVLTSAFQVIEHMARSADARADQAEFTARETLAKRDELLMKFIDADSKRREAELYLELEQNGGTKSDLAVALETFKPALNAAAFKMLGVKNPKLLTDKKKDAEKKAAEAKTAAEPSPEDRQKAEAEAKAARDELEESVDAALDFLIEALKEDPKLLTADRFQRLKGAFLDAMGGG